MWKLSPLLVLLASQVILLGSAQEASLDTFNLRIFGGQNAQLGQFPHMASLRVWYAGQWAHFCGGSIVTQQWILTAAHCLSGYTADQMKVFLGTITVNDGDMYDSELLIEHEDFTIRPIRNDIGLVKLTKQITETPNVHPIRLNDKFISDGVLATASGFGRVNENTGAEILQFVEQTVWPNTKCQSSLNTANFTDNNLCAFNSVGKGVCNGDSGSPLISGRYQIAIASWVRKPCGGGHPDVYLRVDGYLKWISLQVASNS